MNIKEEVDTMIMRDIAELDDLAREVSVCVAKSDNYVNTARQKIASVAVDLDAGAFGDWNLAQWLILKCGLDTDQVPLYLPKPREMATAAVQAHPEMSDRALAKQAGVDPDTISRVRKASTAGNPAVEPRVGLDGKTRRLPIPKAPRDGEAITNWPGMDKADDEIKQWLETYRQMPPKRKKLAYAIFLNLTATGAYL
jgi:hypothetical protein